MTEPMIEPTAEPLPISEPASSDAVAAGEAPRAITAPPLPQRREVTLGDGTTLALREVPGPEGAPVVILLHGWTATADLNWFRCYGPIGDRYRVIAFDHRGHGTGRRSRQGFSLEDCADDVIEVADSLGIDRFVPVGYSMGGTVAQLLWKRHRERVEALVLCATAPLFVERRDERLSFIGLSGLAALARLAPSQARNWITEQVYLSRKTEQWEPWAIEQASTHDWRMILEAGRALGNFSSIDWLGEIDVPTSVIITVRDQVIPIARQIKLIELIRHAEILRVDAGHDAAVAAGDTFVATLLRALTATGVR